MSLPRAIIVLALLIGPVAVRGDDAPAAPVATNLSVAASQLAETLRSGETTLETVHRQRQLAADLKRLLQRGSSMGLDESVPPSQSPSPRLDVPTDPSAPMDSAPLTGSPYSVEQQPVSEGSPMPAATLSDSIWGHLPQHEREELQRTFTEKFLPKYDSALKNYFRKLAEQSSPD